MSEAIKRPARACVHLAPLAFDSIATVQHQYPIPITNIQTITSRNVNELKRQSVL